MNLKFLGGVNEVGRLGMLLEHEGARFLFDYGIAPHDPPQYPQPCPPVDAAFLTHAHLDHSGMMAWVAGRHAVPVVAAPVTQAMAELLAHDSLKVCRLEGYPAPFGTNDVAALAGAWEDAHHGDERAIGKMRVRYHNAGHIPGSTMFEVRNGDHTLLFTGDLNLVDSRLVSAADPVRCDTLVMEATYSGREHPDRVDEEDRFLAAVEDVVSNGGRVVVPAFATGRTQEILAVLAGHGYEVWVDGMGKRVAQIMLQNPTSLRNAKDLANAVQEANFVKSPNQRERALKGDVIVTTSGMVEGGPVMHYLNRIRRDPLSGVFFTGFQVEGSGGRTILEEGVFDVDGDRRPVSCRIERFHFSGHAGHDDLLRFAKACEPQNVVLFHSDQRDALAKDISAFATVHLPETGESVRVA